jgi:hypothetical protein
MLTRLLTTAFFVSLLFIDSTDGKHPEIFRDFSYKGPEYAALGNLRLRADDIRYSDSETIDILGKPYSASKYVLMAEVTVETFEAIGATHISVHEKRPANFEIFVVDDRDRGIHDTFVREMYPLWKKNQLFSGQYLFDFHVKQDHYVLTALPDLVNVKSFYFIWVNGRAIEIRFKSFENNLEGAWGTMDSFTSDCLRIAIDNTEFRAYQYPFRPQKKFVDLFEKGFFNLPSSHN